ncbi:MAG: helix-turn-helix transcriptional regulator [Cyclobacteriaceae bacterium]|nr:helix-turn-helix transcriptional regulator [Cyclobacteriaceae bacterium]MDH4295254.1 helix-turn-helix transcriptional regulator [Cyclobacteriaceae bacterium]MDH5251283.1 helix-turn-helix transcriptional regulator [Cyclobacteriaceae bacterium]
MKLRSHCPTNYALEHFGDKWSLLIVRDLMFKGKRHYNEFFESDERVSTSVLGERLRNLEAVGIISKGEDHAKKSRIRYSLTEKGIALLPLMVEMIIWSGIFDNKTAAGEDFLKKAKKNKAALLTALHRKLKTEHLS